MRKKRKTKKVIFKEIVCPICKKEYTYVLDKEPVMLEFKCKNCGMKEIFA